MKKITQSVIRKANEDMKSGVAASDRGEKLYGFNNYALRLTPTEIKEAWKQASIAVSKK